MSKPTSAVPGAATGSAVCVFAIRPAEPAPVLLPPDIHGHPEGGPLRVLDAGDLAVVVQSVPAAAFAGDALAERLADPGELERCARAHHRVVTTTARDAPVVPLPLATLYLGDERAVAAVRERADGFTRLLDRLRNRSEWGLKVTAAPGAQEAGPSSPDAEDPEGPPAAEPADQHPADGRAYLDRVRGRQRDREQRHEAAWRTAERVYAIARRAAVEARRLRPQDPALAGPGTRQLLNAALLLDQGAEEALRRAIGRLSADPAVTDRARIELTGPWVPYSFARLDEETTADALR